MQAGLVKVDLYVNEWPEGVAHVCHSGFEYNISEDPAQSIALSTDMTFLLLLGMKITDQWDFIGTGQALLYAWIRTVNEEGVCCKPPPENLQKWTQQSIALGRLAQQYNPSVQTTVTALNEVSTTIASIHVPLDLSTFQHYVQHLENMGFLTLHLGETVQSIKKTEDGWDVTSTTQSSTSTRPSNDLIFANGGKPLPGDPVELSEIDTEYYVNFIAQFEINLRTYSPEQRTLLGAQLKQSRFDIQGDSSMKPTDQYLAFMRLYIHESEGLFNIASYFPTPQGSQDVQPRTDQTAMRTQTAIPQSAWDEAQKRAPAIKEALLNSLRYRGIDIDPGLIRTVSVTPGGVISSGRQKFAPFGDGRQHRNVSAGLSFTNHDPGSTLLDRIDTIAAGFQIKLDGTLYTVEKAERPSASTTTLTLQNESKFVICNAKGSETTTLFTKDGTVERKFEDEELASIMVFSNPITAHPPKWSTAPVTGFLAAQHVLRKHNLASNPDLASKIKQAMKEPFNQQRWDDIGDEIDTPLENNRPVDFAKKYPETYRLILKEVILRYCAGWDPDSIQSYLDTLTPTDSSA